MSGDMLGYSCFAGDEREGEARLGDSFFGDEDGLWVRDLEEWPVGERLGIG